VPGLNVITSFLNIVELTDRGIALYKTKAIESIHINAGLVIIRQYILVIVIVHYRYQLD
jgi:hypothetical protein